MKKYVITGMGYVTPMGIETGNFLQPLLEGKSNFQRVPNSPHFYGAIDKTRYVPSHIIEMNPYVKKVLKKDSNSLYEMGLLAAGRAIHSSGLGFTNSKKLNSTVVVASIGTESDVVGGGKSGFARSSMAMPGTLPSLISVKYGITDVLSINAACAGGITAIQQAIYQIEMEDKDFVLVGASDTPMGTTFYGNGERGVRDLSRKEKLVPFGENRDGTMLAEGAGFMVIESMEKAEKRGAEILAVINSVALVTYHAETNASITVDGYQKVINLALKKAKKFFGDIDYVNMHGSGTPGNDLIESEAIFYTFGSNTPVSSIKGNIGHTLAASAILEIIASVEMMNKDIVPGMNVKDIDPEINYLDYVLKNRPVKISSFLKTSAGFNGVYGAVCISKN